MKRKMKKIPKFIEKHIITYYNIYIHLYYNIWASFSPPLRLTIAEALSVKISCVGTAPLSDAIDRLIVFSHRRGTHTHTHSKSITIQK